MREKKVCLTWQREAWEALNAARDLLVAAYERWYGVLHYRLQAFLSRFPSLLCLHFYDGLLSILPPVGEGRELGRDYHSNRLCLWVEEGSPIPFNLNLGFHECRVSTSLLPGSWNLASGWEWGELRRALLIETHWRPREVYGVIQAMEETARWLEKAAGVLEGIPLNELLETFETFRR